MFFKLEKSVQYNLETRHAFWPLRPRFQRSSPNLHWWILSVRLVKVRVGSTLPELHQQEMGVPQGNILSPALFSININNIVKSVLKGTDSLFVDDLPCVFGASLYKRWGELCNYVSTVFNTGSPKVASSVHPLKQNEYMFVDRTFCFQNLLPYWTNLLSK